ncbi:E3 SUMO-protein ligase RanBP2 [Anopheles maculipalpis]|uniref:E3 SUMO-protein ligase RanBP2 n=1 Tax=Anopheles maculipalpis TaxID=1496333 RepID=UPI002159B525|nr:E3 SUMO-protein ligase RanBP2 [Anopheles maculipalpis]
MFSTKKDIDRHVKTSLNKLPENERYLRGLAIARQYFKLNEYASAEHWLSCYLSVQEDSAPAHKLLGQCYEKQKKFDRAITSYQRSLQLDSKQTGLITDVCKLLLMDDNLSKHLSKAKHWCDLAESERINHEAVLNLKLKVANKDATADNKLVKDIILKEILARPLDPLLRVRLVDHFLDEKKVDEAFKYCFELEMKFCEPFMQSNEWTNGVANMLSKYSDSPPPGDGAGLQRHWNYYLLQALVLDRQIHLNLLADSTMETIKRSNLKEIAQKLFKLDQTLQQVAEKGRNAAPQKQMAEAYLQHYRGQWLLYSASLLFKGSQDQQSSAGRSKDVNKKCLALLLMAYQCGVPNPDEPWLKHSSEMARNLLGFWNKQAAFRCCQAGSTLLSCVEDGVDLSVLAQIQNVTETKVWTTADDIVNQIRQLCSDPAWRQNVSRALYSFGDITSKAASGAYFTKDGVAFGEPQYVLPKREQIIMYVEFAQSLYPSSLPYLVYLGLAIGMENLSEFRCKAFPRLNFSTNNLENCNLETLNQLDMDSFLYCSILVAHSNLDSKRLSNQSHQGRPVFLPAANLIPLLCEDSKIDWWSAAYQLIKSSTAKDAAVSVAEQRQLLQHGLQAIRGTGAPLCDVIVLLKLGQVLVLRAGGVSKLVTSKITPEERRYIESRVESVYRAGVLLWKLRNESSYAGGIDGEGGGGGGGGRYGSEMFFKYGGKSYDCQQEVAKLAETAITFLATVYFKRSRYEEFAQDFGGIPLPFAAYFRAEAFKKLDESNKTPLKAKKFYSERARECIRQTQRYLELPYVERDHPLNHVVQNEMKRLSFANDSFDGSLNTSANGGVVGTSADESDHFQSFTSSMTNAGMGATSGTAAGVLLSRSMTERDSATAAAASMCLAKTNDLEALIRQMMETLTFVKEDVLGIRNDVGDMQDRLVKIEENMFRKSPVEAVGVAGTSTSTPLVNESSATVSAAAAAAAMQAMSDMYMMDELQGTSPALAYQHAAAAARTPVMGGVGMAPPQQPAYHNMYGTNVYPNYLPPPGQMAGQYQQQQQMLTPRGHPMTGAMGASPMHTSAAYHSDSLLIPSGGSPAAGGYHHLPAFQQTVLPTQSDSQLVMMHSGPVMSQITTPASTVTSKSGSGGSLSIEQSLQTPALLSSWNNTYNSSNTTFNAPASSASVSSIALSTYLSTSAETKGGAPVNVVITSSDPLPPPPSINSSTFAASSGVQPTYSVTIPPQHIKHSNTGGSIGQGTTGNNNTSTPKPEPIPVSTTVNTKFPMPSIQLAAGDKTTTAIGGPLSTTFAPSFFANMVSPAKNSSSVTNQLEEDDDDDDKNVSGGVEYDPRPDFQPIIPLPDEIVVRTGEEDEEQMFSGRSKLLRLVDREWKERGLGELKILRSKADPAKVRIVMRREQVHKICANHYITPELIIKPMEKHKECYIWAAMDFADEEPKKESFCARFGTVALANEFYQTFVAARDEVARLRAADGGNQQSSGKSSAPPPATVGGSFAFSSTPKSSSTPVSSAVTTAQTTATGVVKPFGDFTFAKNYTPPSVVAKPLSTPTTTGTASNDGKPSPFASFTLKAQTTPAIGAGSSNPFGTIFGGLGFEERDFICAHETTNVIGLKRRDQQASSAWTDCEVSSGLLRLLTSTSTIRLLMRNSDRPSTIYLNHILSKEVQMKAAEKNACSWTVQQDATYPTAKGPLTFMATFKTTDERDRFLSAVQKLLPNVSAAKTITTTTGFGDKFKPKSGSWECPGCYLTNKADTTKCVACNEPRDPTKKDEPKQSTLTGGLFGNLAPPKEGASKFTFGMPPSSVTVTPITFGSVTPATTVGSKKSLDLQSTKPATSTPAKGGTAVSGGGGVGFGEQFKPKPGSWTCNDCYLSNGADALYCVSCESPKDHTVPKKTAGGASSTGGGLLLKSDTSKFSFAAGGGFTIAVASTAAANVTTTAAASVVSSITTVTSTASSNLSQQSFFGGGFSFGSTLKPIQNNSSAASGTIVAAATPEKPVFKFELPTPTGGLSFGSKLTPNKTASSSSIGGDGQTTVSTSSAISKLDPPEKATFGFVFKPKSPGRTLSGEGDGADDDGATGENSVTEEENNTYFAPVIPLPDKVEVKTGEEDEHVLYTHRAKLYRFISSEWKERGIGDVKILKHKETGKLRVVMRREQVLKICLNHALTDDICYTKKDDKSWQFVANDFSEGNFEIMNFCLRFKSSDIAQDFRDAITDALSGKLNSSMVDETKDETKITSPGHNDTTITSTSSPIGALNFSKLSDISLNDRETAQKLKLPDNFFETTATTTPCAGCRGCDSDTFVFPTVEGKQSATESDGDDQPLPIDIKSVKPLPPVAPQSSLPNKVLFGGAQTANIFGGDNAAKVSATPAAPIPGLFSGLSFKVPAGTGSSVGPASTTSTFLSAEKKSSASPFMSATSIFGGVQPSSTAEQTATSGTNAKFAFGSSVAIGSAASGGSIFSASLNTTPKTSFVAPAGSPGAQVTSTTVDNSKTTTNTVVAAAKQTNTSSPLLQPASLTTPPSGKMAEGAGKFFGSSVGGFGSSGGFGSTGSTNMFSGGNIFGGTSTKTATSATATPPSSAVGSTPAPTTTISNSLFGSVAFGDAGKPSIFGGASGFTFGSLAKQSTTVTTSSNSVSSTNNSDAPSLFKMDDSVSFATLASSNSPAFSNTLKQTEDGTKSAGGFVGLTVKEDFFSRSASAKLNNSTDGAGANNTEPTNGNRDEMGAMGGEDGTVAAGGEENYDPYYAPVIQLPDEIEVRTGEEEETKLFGERAKLFRYDATTKEWKERGVGELKILHHPVRNTYRLLLRREQIFKLVLNHAITADLSITPMNNSDKAFVWGAMNHAEAPGQLEQLAARFKNEGIASEFRSTLERCQEKLRARPDLEPDQD